MRAIGVTEFGGPENLQVLDVPEPHAGPGEVRIRVHAAAVNPTDSGLRAGRYAARHTSQQGPFIPGADAAGAQTAVGGVHGRRVHPDPHLAGPGVRLRHVQDLQVLGASELCHSDSSHGRHNALTR